MLLAFPGILLALGLVLFAVLSASRRPLAVATLGEKWFLAGMAFALFLILWGYFSLFEAFWHGQTPGKRVMKIRVIKDSGRQITLFEALARNLLRPVDYMPGLYLAGVITMLANKRSKRLGDLAAGTLVIHERVEAQPLMWTGSTPPSSTGFAPAPAQALFPADAVARLSSPDLQVLETFFARALDLPLETRAAMAGRILGEMTARMGTPAPAGNPERALEALATQLRGQRRY